LTHDRLLQQDRADDSTGVKDEAQVSWV
jgi:hypothetical protein